MYCQIFTKFKQWIFRFRNYQDFFFHINRPSVWFLAHKQSSHIIKKSRCIDFQEVFRKLLTLRRGLSWTSHEEFWSGQLIEPRPVFMGTWRLALPSFGSHLNPISTTKFWKGYLVFLFYTWWKKSEKKMWAVTFIRPVR